MTKECDERELLAEIAAALREPDVPAGILQAARSGYTWRTVDAELAELAYDSAAADVRLVGVRGTGAGVRSLSFESPGLQIELDITADCLVGQVLPPGAGTLELHSLDRQQAAEPVRQLAVDSTGRFRVSPVPGHAFRLGFTAQSGERVLTDLVTL